ncbi:MAG: ECF transporter S component [Methanomassiliicoccales archaeon]|nr:MAG: ECF transporter S component [Methanomassiliicoccales archaeon]
MASIGMAFLLLYMAVFMSSLVSEYAAFLSFILLLLILGVIFAKFEESEISSKEVALIGILAAITAASRIPFAALPNIKPCTFLIIVTGLVFGVLAGAMVGSMTAFVSNMFFGQGPWTAWEMVAWAMVGMIAGHLGQRMKEITVKDVVLLGIILGMAYNTLMDFSSWITFYKADPDLFIPTFVAGLPFGALHIFGNVIFALVLGGPTIKIFQRFRQRIRVTYGHREPQVVRSD